MREWQVYLTDMVPAQSRSIRLGPLLAGSRADGAAAERTRGSRAAREQDQAAGGRDSHEAPHGTMAMLPSGRKLRTGRAGPPFPGTTGP